MSKGKSGKKCAPDDQRLYGPGLEAMARTLGFMLSEMGNPWKVVSRGALCAISGFERITWAVAWRRDCKGMTLEEKIPGRRLLWLSRQEKMGI